MRLERLVRRAVLLSGFALVAGGGSIGLAETPALPVAPVVKEAAVEAKAPDAAAPAASKENVAAWDETQCRLEMDRIRKRLSVIPQEIAEQYRAVAKLRREATEKNEKLKAQAQEIEKLRADLAVKEKEYETAVSSLPEIAEATQKQKALEKEADGLHELRAGVKERFRQLRIDAMRTKESTPAAPEAVNPQAPEVKK